MEKSKKSLKHNLSQEELDILIKHDKMLKDYMELTYPDCEYILDVNNLSMPDGSELTKEKFELLYLHDKLLKYTLNLKRKLDGNKSTKKVIVN